MLFQLGVLESEVLTGNNLGRLGNLEKLPSVSEIETIGNTEEVQHLTKKEIHLLAQRILEEGNSQKALTLLMHAENL